MGLARCWAVRWLSSSQRRGHLQGSKGLAVAPHLEACCIVQLQVSQDRCHGRRFAVEGTAKSKVTRNVTASSTRCCKVGGRRRSSAAPRARCVEEHHHTLLVASCRGDEQGIFKRLWTPLRTAGVRGDQRRAQGGGRGAFVSGNAHRRLRPGEQRLARVGASARARGTTDVQQRGRYPPTNSPSV